MSARVIACGSFSRHAASPAHELVRAFRAGDDGAYAKVLADVLAGLAREAPELTAGRVTIVAMPGHAAGTRLAPLDQLAQGVADRQPGWRAVPRALIRTTNAPEAKDGGARDPGAEAATLCWTEVAGDGAVLLLDDVTRTGASLEAAWLAAPVALRVRIVGLTAFRALD